MSAGISFPGLRNGFPEMIHYRMEDETAFAEWDFDSSATPAANGGPPTHYVGAGTLYPVGLSLAEVAELYWRVRKYQIVSNVVSTWGGGAAFGGGSASGSAENAATTKEYELTRAFGYGAVITDPPIYGFGDYGDIHLSFQIYKIDFPGTPVPAPPHALRFWDGQYWPSIYVGAEFDDGILVLGAGSMGYQDILAPAWMPESAATCDLLGHTIKLYGASDETHTGSISVTGEEWWGYGGKFDTTTGERL